VAIVGRNPVAPVRLQAAGLSESSFHPTRSMGDSGIVTLGVRRNLLVGEAHSQSSASRGKERLRTRVRALSSLHGIQAIATS
jgi:hypothetical protein